MTLLTRSTRNVELTPAGQAYLHRAVQILAAVEDATEQARRVADGIEGRMTIGCVGSATYSLLPQLAVASDLIPPIRRAVSGHTSLTVDQAEPGRP